MTDRNELRRLAESAKEFGLSWYGADYLECDGVPYVSDERDFIAAASPDVVLGLLDEIERLNAEIEDRIKAFDTCHRQAMDNGNACIVAERERDQLREEAQHALVIVSNIGRELGVTQHERDQLRVVLVKIAEFDPAVTHGWAECVREMARSALKAR